MVDLVLQHQPGLDRAAVTSIAERVAGGRAKRRGENWYCGVCGPRREPCAACGQPRRVSCRDRDGRPRCTQCPLDDGRDPTALIVEAVTEADPSLSAEVIGAAAIAAAAQAGQRHRLAWALQNRPDLLTGAGAQAPVPTVLRLIDRLCELEARTIVRPACPGCGRVIHLHRPIGAKWLCRNCTAKTRAQPCARCGAVREAATRDEHGKPLCPYCLITDPVNQETCIDCGRRRPVSVRTDNGPVCAICRPVKTMTCSICGHDGPCTVSAAAPSMTHAAPNASGTSPDSGAPARDAGSPGACIRVGVPAARCSSGCAVQQRLRELLGDEVLVHLEWIRTREGALTCSGLQLVRYRSEERLDELMQIHRDHGVAIANPHVYIVEDGKQGRINPAVVAMKARLDPQGLLNPGKLRGWDERDALAAAGGAADLATLPRF
jgi:hypothetical protein